MFHGPISNCFSIKQPLSNEWPSGFHKNKQTTIIAALRNRTLKLKWPWISIYSQASLPHRAVVVVMSGRKHSPAYAPHGRMSVASSRPGPFAFQPLEGKPWPGFTTFDPASAAQNLNGAASFKSPPVCRQRILRSASLHLIQ